MKDLIEYADRVKKPVYLSPAGRSYRLISWYEGFGFKDKPKDDLASIHKMKREPKNELV